jgi:hypothetical protein
MRNHNLLALAALASLAACVRQDAPEGAADSAIAAATETQSVARNPHVRAFELGLAVDSATSRITGGVKTSFHPDDTIFVSVRTEFVPEGASLGLRLVRGKTTVDSIGMKSATPNAEELATVAAHFAPPARGWSLGGYRLEVFLDGASQGLTDFEVVK